jgi:uncharacterized protein
MPRVMRFEIAAQDMGRSKKFYEEIFGWKIAKTDEPDSQGDDYYDIDSGKELPGIEGGLMKATAQLKEGKSGFICSIDVPDLDGSLKKIEELGGKILRPKTAADEMGWFAYAEDPDGNVFAVMQFKEGAKERYAEE